MAKFADEAAKLQRGQHSTHPDLQGFDTWMDVQEYANSPDGRELSVQVRLVDKYGAERIRQIATQVCHESQADVVVSTSHKAKGREWSKVRIANDFGDLPLDEDGMILRPEQMLSYVSVTRAMHQLDRGPLKLIDHFVAVPRARVADDARKMSLGVQSPEGRFPVGSTVKFVEYEDDMPQDEDDFSVLVDRMNKGATATVVEVREVELSIGDSTLTQVDVELDGERRTFAHFWLEPVGVPEPLKV